jgi:hypothetical protein
MSDTLQGAIAFVATLPPHLPCTELRTNYPRILTKLALRHHDAWALNELFDELLQWGPHREPGLSQAALLELTDLRDHMLAVLRRRRISAWGDLYTVA